MSKKDRTDSESYSSEGPFDDRVPQPHEVRRILRHLELGEAQGEWSWDQLDIDEADLQLIKLAEGALSPDESQAVFERLLEDPVAEKKFQEYLELSAMLDAERAESAPQPRRTDRPWRSGASAPLPSLNIVPSPPVKNEGDRDGAAATGSRARSSRFRFRWVKLMSGGLAAAAAVMIFGSSPTVQSYILRLSGNKDAVVEMHAAVLFDRDGVGHGVVGRMSHPRADVPRFDPMMSGESSSKAWPLAGEMERELEAVHACRALAAAWLFRGRPEAALQALEPCEDSADLRSDRAAILLTRYRAGDFRLSESLRWASTALEMEPEHRQAQWNRAKILESLRLPFGAARAFERVAELENAFQSEREGANPWVESATENAKRLSSETDALLFSRQMAIREGEALVADRTPVSKTVIRTQPGLMRKYFHHALLAAESRLDVEALSPMAQLLDAQSPVASDSLTEVVKHMATVDFATRGPLARKYRDIFLKKAEEETVQASLTEFERVGAHDLLLGALSLREPRDIQRIRALTQTVRNPWFESGVLIEMGRKAALEFRFEDSERLYRQAEAKAVSHYRKLQANAGRVQLYTEHHRLADAESLLKQAMNRAWSIRDFDFYMKLVLQRAHLAVWAQQPHLARALFEEIREFSQAQHGGNGCWYGLAVKVAYARLELSEHRLDRVLPILNEVDDGHDFEMLSSLQIRAEVQRMQFPTADLTELKAQMEAHMERTGDERAHVRILPAWATLTQKDVAPDAAAVQVAVVENALEELRHEPAVRSTEYARDMAYQALITHAAWTRQFDEAWHRFAQEAEVDVPSSCAVGLHLKVKHRIVVWKDETGQVDGVFDHRWNVPESVVDPSTLVPKAGLDAVKNCSEIAVLARGELAGEARLLPVHLASYFLVGGPKRELSPGSSLGTRLVISNVAYGYEDEGLSSLPSYDLRSSAPLVRLTGHEATARRILTALPQASEIEIFTHGWFDARSLESATLVVAPEPGEGRGRLTAQDIAKTTLQHRPLVILAAGSAAGHEGDRAPLGSLPRAFLQAGARAVFAPATKIRASLARALLGEVRQAMRAGVEPAQALREVRVKPARSDEEARARRGLVVFQTSR